MGPGPLAACAHLDVPRYLARCHAGPIYRIAVGAELVDDLHPDSLPAGWLSSGRFPRHSGAAARGVGAADTGTALGGGCIRRPARGDLCVDPLRVAPGA